MAEPGRRLLISCEHGGNLVPEEWQRLFAGAEAVLASHRGYDPGAAELARWLAERLRAPLYVAEVTRLLVDLNRSPGHPALFSEFSRSLGEKERQELLARYYRPFRDAVTAGLDRMLANHGRVCHLSVHSFTPELKAEVRNADIGLLYDSRRLLEQRFCRDWQRTLARFGTGWRVRRNYPYRGAADGFVTFLRRRYPAASYLGLELEVNQKWPLQGGVPWQRLQEQLGKSLAVVLEGC